MRGHNSKTPLARSLTDWSHGFSIWNNAIAAALDSPSSRSACRSIGIGLSALLDSDTWYVVFFRRNETPVMFDYFDADTRKDRYEDGPYLLDPFYTSFLKGDPEGCYLKKDISPEDLSEIELYTKYDQEIFGPMDEVGLVTDIDENTRSLFCVARAELRTDRAPYAQHHLDLFDNIAPVIQSIVRSVWADVMAMDDDSPSSRAAKHTRIEAFFTSFGSDKLTTRETEIGNLMLKGFNAREISGFLDISYGTARNHIKKVYFKLEVSSQSELCGLFIEQLLNS